MKDSDNVVWLTGQPEYDVNTGVRATVDCILNENPDNVIVLLVKDDKITRMIASGLAATEVLGWLEIGKATVIHQLMSQADEEE